MSCTWPLQVDAKDNSGGRTALYVAAVGGRADCVQLLLEHGADLDAKVMYQFTPLPPMENLFYNFEILIEPTADIVGQLILGQKLSFGFAS
jgi:ankyrin repeat protein